MKFKWQKFLDCHITGLNRGNKLICFLVNICSLNLCTISFPTKTKERKQNVYKGLLIGALTICNTIDTFETAYGHYAQSLSATGCKIRQIQFEKIHVLSYKILSSGKENAKHQFLRLVRNTKLFPLFQGHHYLKSKNKNVWRSVAVYFHVVWLRLIIFSGISKITH